MSYTAKFDGFGIRDAKTGEALIPYNVAKMSFPQWKWLSEVVNGFALDWEGFLLITTENDSIYRIPKEGKYLIRFDDNGEFMKW